MSVVPGEEVMSEISVWASHGFHCCPKVLVYYSVEYHFDRSDVMTQLLGKRKELTVLSQICRKYFQHVILELFPWKP